MNSMEKSIKASCKRLEIPFKDFCRVVEKSRHGTAAEDDGYDYGNEGTK